MKAYNYIMASHPSVCHGRIAPDCWPFLAQHDPCDPWCSERTKWRGKRWCSVWPFWWQPQGGESPIQPCHPENSASPLFDCRYDHGVWGFVTCWRISRPKKKAGIAGMVCWYRRVCVDLGTFEMSNSQSPYGLWHSGIPWFVRSWRILVRREWLLSLGHQLCQVAWFPKRWFRIGYN